MTVNAMPTKRFFIDMLTRDIELVPAVIDLVDNCADGARRLRGDGPYDGLSVRLTVNQDEFVIADNCGGIDIDVAKKYAFRFGRDPEMKRTDRSIGQFGVGMKRALFKLGSRFKVESKADGSAFELDVDVEKWSKESEWNFRLATSPATESVPEDERGTIITVDALHPSVSEDFAQPGFESRLREELARAHQSSVSDGLAITINGMPLVVEMGKLLQSTQIKPAFREMSLNGSGEPVNVKIYCGVAGSRPKDAGWYVFCNGRLVLEADQTPVTGWGERDGMAIPSYHNQFSTFRGYVFMESNDAGRLPWTTTKTALDSDSKIYRKVRQDMLLLMRPVIDFLNKLDRENDREEEEGPGPLTVAMEKAKEVALPDAQTGTEFVSPPPEDKKVDKGPKQGRVTFSADAEKLKLARSKMKVSTYKEVGERAFDYFYELECEEG
jgi:hypothetical protein